MHDSFNGKFRDDEVSGTLTPEASRWTPRTGQKVCVPVLTPDRSEKRQNGRRFKEDGDPSFTLTSQDRHGDAVAVDTDDRTVDTDDRTVEKVPDDVNTVGFKIEADGTVRTIKSQYQQTSGANLVRGGTFGASGAAVEIRVSNEDHPGIVVELPNGVHAYAVWYPKRQCYVAIRKLTPRECFRLQGWTDEYFDKAQFVNSDSQLYKQAGNGVTVNVVEIIGHRLAEIMEESVDDDSKRRD